MQRHPFDVISFLFGALFVGAGVSAVLFDESFASIDGRGVWPVVLIIAGVGVLTATLGGRRRNGSTESDPPSDDDADLDADPIIS